ncbi:hypothetical protein ACFL2T_00650 [Elusimicrobiota bacterium]
MRRGHSNKLLYGLIRQNIAGAGRFGIALTHHQLEDNSFNRHDEKVGVGIVTIHGARHFIPSGKTLQQYLSFLVLCEAFCLVGETDFEHSGRVDYCLFDLCTDKDDLGLCLTKSYIDKTCRERLARAGGFTEGQVAEAEKILDYTRSIDHSFALKKGLGHPVSSLLAGLLAGCFVGTTISTLRGPFYQLVFFLVILLLLYSVWRFGYPRRP